MAFTLGQALSTFALVCFVSATAVSKGYGFGTNTQFQLGTTLDSTDNPYVALHPVPLELFASTPIKSLVAGVTHTVAITAWGSIYRWGQNTMGQLGGLVNTPQLTTPEMLVLLEPAGSRKLNVWNKAVSAIAVGDAHVVVLTESNEIYCWGDNTRFQLGSVIPFVYTPSLRVERNSTNFTSPANVSRPYTRMHNFTTPLLRSNAVSLLEVSSTVTAPTAEEDQPKWTSQPISVLGIISPFGFKSVHASGHRSAVITNSGQIWVWGDNRDGLIGVLTDDDYVKPSMVDGAFGPVQHFGMGLDFFVALDDDQHVWVWGDNSDNQLGLGPGAPKYVETAIEIPYFRDKNITNISVGYQHTILWTKGRVFAFGNNEYGQLGFGDFDVHEDPVELTILHGVAVSSVASGRGHTILLSENGGVYVWGLNSQGQLGIGDTTTRPLPTRLVALESQGLKLAAAGYATSFVWTEPGN